MPSRMVFSSTGSVCGFAGSELPITIYPGGHKVDEQISISWSLSLEQEVKLAEDLLQAVAAVRSALPLEPCARCGSVSGVQFKNEGGCTACFLLPRRSP
jgi:hypothetical protein